MKSVGLLVCLFAVVNTQVPLWNYYRNCYPYGQYGQYRGYGGYGYNSLNTLPTLPYSSYSSYYTGLPSTYSGLPASYTGLGGLSGLNGIGCRDRSPNCAYLAAMGECATNPIATRTICPISCGTGCAGLGTGVGTMDALADSGLYSNSLLYNSISPYTSGIYRKEPSEKSVLSRPAEKS
uniref:ShKT domain-containing protein n=1 Tax=Panagrolaimus sp. JU765 TaxID=591449 RepID=A0AC34Q5B0_9BILA